MVSKHNHNGAETLEAILGRLAAGGTGQTSHRWWSLQRLSLNPRALAVAASMAVFTTAAVGGAAYSFGTVSSGELLAAQLSARTAVPLVDSKGVFVGSLPTPLARDAQNDSIAPVVKSPKVLRRAALVLEDRDFLETRWPCRVNLASTLARVVLSVGSSAGSGVSLQTSKQLSFPAADEGVLARVARKVTEYGRACGIASQLDDADALLDLYLTTAPMLQGAGTTRGADHAARILFGHGVASTSAAEQLILAAAIKRPIQVQRPGDSKISCGDAAALTTSSRRSWCRTVDRARYAARQVLEREALAVALGDLEQMEQVGPVFATTGAGSDIDADPRIVNPVVRARLLLEGIPLERLREDSAKATSLPVRLAADVSAQRRAMIAVRQSLQGAEEARIFCVPIVARELNGADCGARQGARAAVLAVEADAVTGEIQRHIALGQISLETRIQLGSLSKLIGALALAAAGVDDATLVCPRALMLDGKVMRRAGDESSATGVPHGVPCGAHLKSIAKSIAMSDNLAFYEALGLVDSAALREAARALGVELPDGEAPRFAIAFGTLRSTPGQALEMLRRLAQAAGLLLHYEPGLRFVALDKGSKVQKPADGPVLTPAKAEVLATLLKAPVSTSGGTLRFARDMGVYAGKTGTTTIEVAGVRYDAAKYAVMLSKDGKIGFFAVSGDGAPLGKSVPLRLFKTTLAQII